MHIISKILLLITCLLATEVISLSGSPVSKCYRNYGDLPSNVTIEGCDGTPCKIQKYSRINAQVGFIAPHYIETATAYATAYVTFLGIPIPLDLGDNKNTCKFIKNTRCPIQRGEFVSLSIGIDVGDVPVGYTAPVEIFVVDQNTSPIGCIRIQAITADHL